LKRQFAWARAVAEAMGLQCFADRRYEADDLIGTLAEFWSAKGHPICVVTADKDLAQLVGEQDYWWDFSRNQKLNAKQLTEKFGVMPEQMADYLALTGDPVDNIPGVPGVGPKSASALLGHFGDMDTLYKRLDEVQHLGIRGAKSLQRKLTDHRDAAELARRLTLIEKRVESALASPELGRTETDTARLNRLFDDLAFFGMLRQRCLRA
jgi:DNA polymerase-1